MKRFEAMRTVMAAVKDEPVVVTLGHAAQELYQLRDRPENFYMLGSMGMATSIAHGIALSRPGKVVVLDGDAAVTMNMGELATIGFNLTPNLVVVIIDNEASEFAPLIWSEPRPSRRSLYVTLSPPSLERSGKSPRSLALPLIIGRNFSFDQRRALSSVG